MKLNLSPFFKSILPCFFTLLLFTSRQAKSQNTYIGVNLGVSINDLTEEFNWRNYSCRHGCDITDVSPQSGRYYGIEYRTDLSTKLAITVGLGYERFGFEETIQSTELVPVLNDQQFKGKPIRLETNIFESNFETSYSAISLPIGVRYYAMGADKPNKLFLSGGAAYHYKTQESFTPYEQSSSTLFEHNFSAFGGLGYERRWNKHALSFGPSFSYSLTNWNDDENFQREEKFRPIQLRLNLGYAYAIK